MGCFELTSKFLQIAGNVGSVKHLETSHWRNPLNNLSTLFFVREVSYIYLFRVTTCSLIHLWLWYALYLAETKLVNNFVNMVKIVDSKIRGGQDLFVCCFLSIPEANFDCKFVKILFKKGARKVGRIQIQVFCQHEVDLETYCACRWS